MLPRKTLQSNHDLMLSMFDVVEKQATQVTTAAGTIYIHALQQWQGLAILLLQPASKHLLF